MVVGFNHNFRYKDAVYHVQTEDGGLKFPFIITHLFIGGTILKTKKTSYADILKTDRLEQVVEELMKEQHRDMLRRLRSGEFDEIIEKFRQIPGVVKSVAAPGPKEGAVPSPPPAPSPASASPAAAPAPEARPAPPPSPPVAAPVAPVTPVAAAAATAPVTPAARDTSLDDIILSYLLGEKGQ